MTNIELQKILLEYANTANCFTKEVRDILIDYKRLGGQRDTVKKVLEEIKTRFPENECIQAGADDMLDMVTGYCSTEMRVWE